MNDINYIEMGMRIKQLRIKRGLTVERLAELLGVGVRVIYRWQNGETVPSVEHLYVLAQVLDTTMEYILTGK